MGHAGVSWSSSSRSTRQNWFYHSDRPGTQNWNWWLLYMPRLSICAFVLCGSFAVLVLTLIFLECFWWEKIDKHGARGFLLRGRFKASSQPSKHVRWWWWAVGTCGAVDSPVPRKIAEETAPWDLQWLWGWYIAVDNFTRIQAGGISNASPERLKSEKSWKHRTDFQKWLSLNLRTAALRHHEPENGKIFPNLVSQPVRFNLDKSSHNLQTRKCIHLSRLQLGFGCNFIRILAEFFLCMVRVPWTGPFSPQPAAHRHGRVLCASAAPGVDSQGGRRAGPR